MGYFIFYRKIIGGKAAEFPLLFIACSVVFVYILGLIGMLALGYYVLLTAGLILLPVAICKTEKTSRMKLGGLFLDPAIIFLIIGCIWVRFVTRDVGVSNPDDFSHWYRLCKVLYYDNSFPLTQEIQYTTYPPGTAVWIYIITKSFGFSIANCFTAQSAIIISSVCMFFCVIPEKSSSGKKILCWLYIVASYLILSSATVSNFALIVDGVLGFVALGCVVFVLNNKHKKSYFLLMFLLTFLVTIKFSGLLFSLFVCVIYFFTVHTSKTILKTVALLLTPIGLSLLYRVRNSLVLKNVDSSAHAVSIDRLMTIQKYKTDTFKNYIAVKTIKQSASFFGTFVGNNQVKLIWLSFFGLLLIALFEKINKSEKDNHRSGVFKVLVISFIFYWVYVVFLILTYIFSMTHFEAYHLASYYRYMGTVAVLMLGIFSFSLLRILAKQTSIVVYPLIISYVLLSMLSISNYDFILGGIYYSPYDRWLDYPWVALNSVAEEGKIYTEDSYLVIWDQSIWDGYKLPDFCLTNIEMTFFRSCNVNHIIVDTAQYNNTNNVDYDHVVVVYSL
ncbi:MAG: hypothetical protein IJ757_05485 [Clostridiales bacterium]|nr:hypothetical protein [Clostridiales bacterium]